MNKVDLIIIVIVGIPVLMGISGGFLKNLFGFVSIVVGLFIATRYSYIIADIFLSLDWFSKLANGIAFIGVIIMFYMVGMLIARRLSRLNSFTSTVDKIAGGIFGALQGLIIASLVLLFCKSFGIFAPETLDGSLLYSHIAGIAPEVFDFVANIFPSTKSFFQEMKVLTK